MTVYTVQVEDRIFQVVISGNQLSIDGIKEQARLIQLNANNFFLLCRERHNLALHLEAQEGNAYAVIAAGRRVIAQVESWRGGSKAVHTAEATAANQLRAPMPGMIVSVQVNEGDRVEKGQVLIRQESMKMQMELRAPVTGKVVKIATLPQTQVEKGALLVEIQPQE
jgi:biotin carboxyl carrier protein